jgi:hypothetical protein
MSATAALCPCCTGCMSAAWQALLLLLCSQFPDKLCCYPSCDPLSAAPSLHRPLEVLPHPLWF